MSCNDNCCGSLENEIVVIKFKKLSEDAIIPKYQKEGDAAFDFHAVVDTLDYVTGKKEIYVAAKGQKIVRTGLAMSIPKGYELQIRPRSGLAAKNAITITNSPGTIDSFFRDEIKIIVFNLGTDEFKIQEGDRIAQGVLNKIPLATIEEIEDFSKEDSKNDRGGGFGSTGI